PPPPNPSPTHLFPRISLCKSPYCPEGQQIMLALNLRRLHLCLSASIRNISKVLPFKGN
ncbi:hypothetical protein STEG23_020746, partial [Scotinomys teguina]